MKQTHLLLFASAISIFSLMTSCQKATVSPQHNLAPALQIAASVHGTVVDENESPVAGALVTTESVTAVTDDKGKFVISEVALYQQGGDVKVEKDGYLLASGSFALNEGVSEKLQIRLSIRTNRQNAAGALIVHSSQN